MTSTRLLAATLVGGIAIAAAGCGGNDSQTSASTQWAGDLCSAITTWKTSVTSAVDSIKDNPSQDGVQQAVGDAKDATETLVDTVKGLGAPDTQSGDQAKTAVDTLATELQGDVDTIQQAVSDASGVQGLLAAVSTVTTTVSSMSSQLSSSVDDLGSILNADDELRQSFEDADSCDGVIPSGS
jgi:gas vesicle protein